MPVQICRAQGRSVTQHQLCLLHAGKLLRQLGKANGAVRAKPLQLPLMAAKQRIIDLIAPCIHGAHQKPLEQQAVVCHGLQRGYTAAGLILCPRKALQSRHTDTQARKAARP